MNDIPIEPFLIFTVLGFVVILVLKFGDRNSSPFICMLILSAGFFIIFLWLLIDGQKRSNLSDDTFNRRIQPSSISSPLHFTPPGASQMMKLSSRERQVSRLIKLGWKPRHIGPHLRIGVRYVDQIRMNIIRKRGPNWFAKKPHRKKEAKASAA